MNVLSLCDGMSCGQIAFKELGIPVEHYFSSEIKDIAIKVTQENFPKTIQIGNVKNISYRDGVLYTEKGEYGVQIDLVMFGSPCQTFSIAMKTDLRIGLEDDAKSGLFYECYRVLKEVNPKYFFVENVASMTDENRNILSECLGVQPKLVQASDYGPVLRKRYYWTNLEPMFALSEKPKNFQDILDEGYTDREKGHALLVSDSRPLTSPIKMIHRYFNKGFRNVIFKDKEQYEFIKNYFDENLKGKSAAQIDAMEIPEDVLDKFAGVRYMNRHEAERCHGVPEGYTDCLTENQARDVLGDGWSVYVIKTFFRHLIEGRI